jgi:hypothetical protein
VTLAGWQHQSQVGEFPADHLHVPVLHVLEVRGPDIAIDHKHDHIVQIRADFDPANQSIIGMFSAAT